MLAAPRARRDEREGDLLAQAGANDRGAARLVELADAMGARRPARAQRALADYAETRVRAALSAAPATASGRSSTTSTTTVRGTGPIAIRCTLRIGDGGVAIDLSESDPQVRGKRERAVDAVAVSAACFVLRCLVPADVPVNAGCWRPLRVVTRPGTVVDARPPAAVGAGNVEGSQRICDAIFGAFAQAVPDLVGAASQGTMNNVLIGGVDATACRSRTTRRSAAGRAPGRGGRARPASTRT